MSELIPIEASALEQRGCDVVERPTMLGQLAAGPVEGPGQQGLDLRLDLHRHLLAGAAGVGMMSGSG